MTTPETSTAPLLEPPLSFWARHEFVIRRLHSLSGLIPVGAYLVVHLLTNASVLDSPNAFQRRVYLIHSLGSILWLVEWTFIFIPLIFHAAVGVVIIQGGLPNHGTYPRGANVRYSLQRVSGMIALLFILWHVFHMHGWFHFEGYVEGFARQWNGANFRAYNATSTAAAAIQQSWVIQLLYAIGVIASVFHLANGIWSMGITWGVWISPAAQQRALKACTAFGVVVGAIGLGAVWGMMRVDVDAARAMEDRMYQSMVESGQVDPNPHKRSHPLEQSELPAAMPHESTRDSTSPHGLGNYSTIVGD